MHYDNGTICKRKMYIIVNFLLRRPYKEFWAMWRLRSVASDDLKPTPRQKSLLEAQNSYLLDPLHPRWSSQATVPARGVDILWHEHPERHHRRSVSGSRRCSGPHLPNQQEDLRLRDIQTVELSVSSRQAKCHIWAVLRAGIRGSWWNAEWCEGWTGWRIDR